MYIEGLFYSRLYIRDLTSKTLLFLLEVLKGRCHHYFPLQFSAAAQQTTPSLHISQFCGLTVLSWVVLPWVSLQQCRSDTEAGLEPSEALSSGLDV